MAEVNPELAKLVVQLLGQLKIGVNNDNFYVGMSDDDKIAKRIDAYGAAFQRLYGLVAGSPGMTSQVQEAMDKIDAISAPQPGS